MYKEINTQRYECKCERCGYIWISNSIPISCSKCKTRSWNVKSKNDL